MEPIHPKDYSILELMRAAYKAAEHSNDDSTQNGAVMLIGDTFITECNHYPEKVKITPERLARPLKYEFIEHAERGIIYKAAKFGLPTDQQTMIVPWAACSNCARAIVQSGVKKIIVHQECMDKTPDRWKESIDIAMQIMHESEIEIEYFAGKIGGVKVLFNGEYWEP